jgi:hypothetical protein
MLALIIQNIPSSLKSAMSSKNKYIYFVTTNAAGPKFEAAS